MDQPPLPPVPPPAPPLPPSPKADSPGTGEGPTQTQPSSDEISATQPLVSAAALLAKQQAPGTSGQRSPKPTTQDEIQHAKMLFQTSSRVELKTKARRGPGHSRQGSKIIPEDIMMELNLLEGARGSKQGSRQHSRNPSQVPHPFADSAPAATYLGIPALMSDGNLPQTMSGDYYHKVPSTPGSYPSHAAGGDIPGPTPRSVRSHTSHLEENLEQVHRMNSLYAEQGADQNAMAKMATGLMHTVAHKGDEEPTERYCFLNNAGKNQAIGYVKNQVKTSKYTWWNFVPKSLFEQFRRVFNIYYLFVVIISFIPGVSPVAPAVNLVPLIFILGFGIARELYEDVKRALADNTFNNSIYNIVPRIGHTTTLKIEPDIGSNGLERVKCKDIEVGDILYLRKGDLIPADILILVSSDASGVCYVSTANLDGETNLKRLNAVSAQTNSARKLDEVRDLKGVVTCEKENPALYHFEGHLSMEGGDPIPADSSNLGLRGSRLRNTQFVYGIVVYAGYDTKEALNMRIPPYKFGEIEKLLNYIVIALCISLLCICIAYATAGAIMANNVDGAWYLGQGYVDDAFGDSLSAESWFISLATFLILFASYVPVALFVTLELIRVVQTVFMQLDVKMFSRGRSARSTASNLNETLSQIDYICSDKTGTLTENEMKYVACSVYGQVVDSRKEPDIMVRLGRDRAISQVKLNGEAHSSPNADGTELKSPSHAEALVETPELCEAVQSLTLAMAVCHNVVPEPKDDADALRESSAIVDIESGGGESGAGSAVSSTTLANISKLIEYQGSSPDEVALVHSARSFGIELLARSQDSVVIKMYDTVIQYDVLAELEFNSDRKRMSVVLRDKENSKYWLYTKGADNIMLGLMDPSQKDILDKAAEHVDFFAREGLRTLLFARKELTEQECTEFLKQFNEAKASLVDRESKVDAVEAAFETNLSYLGISAVEDRLQTDLAPTIAFLRKAGIKIWVLTGDKRQTAESIGYSSALLDAQSMDVRHIEAHDYESAESRVDEILKEIGSTDDVPKKEYPSKSWIRRMWNGTKKMVLWKKYLREIIARESKRKHNMAIIIDGVSLQCMLADELPSMQKSEKSNASEKGDDDDKKEDEQANRKKFWQKKRSKSKKGAASAAEEAKKKNELDRDPNREPNLTEKFMHLCDHCETVICCRVTPLQKALVVRMIQSLRDKITLAIGDGANDVSMIQEAHIGVGIYGKEGMNASRAADYSFSEFRFLRRLLCVHGRYAYVRTAGMMNMQFYKNMFFVCVQFFYQYMCLFSGNTVFNQWYISTFNVVVTSIPPFIYGCFERDLRASTLMNHPELYRSYRLYPLIGIASVAEYAGVYAVLHSIVVFVFGTYSIGDTALSDGQLSGFDYYGFALVSAVTFVVLVKMMMMTHWWNWLFLLSIAVSIGIFYIIPPFFIAALDESNLIGVLEETMQSSAFWLFLVLTMTVSLMPDFFFYMYRRILREPSNVELFQEAEVDGKGFLLKSFE